MGVRRYFSIHAHFYQPPRQDPWTGEIYENTNTDVYSSFNQMITDECYGPLALKRVKYLTEFFEEYTFLSFDFGPTLLTYIERNYPRLYISIINSDKKAQKLFGYPLAIACVYNHSILPNLPLHQKKLYVKWGIESFEKVFGRKPFGMWISECACDEETLEILIHYGIGFTILSPHQIKNIIGENKVSSKVEPGLYFWRSKVDKQKKIVLFVYDRDLSELSFREIWNSEKFFLRIKSSFANKNFSFLATDGENYGHHIKNGDIYLSRLLERLLNSNLSLINLNAVYHILKPEFEVEITQNTSWSCPHGVSRWGEPCGCRIDPKARYQGWKKTLKKSVDEISNIADDFFTKNMLADFQNPWDVLERYITIYESVDPHQSVKFIKSNSRKPILGYDITKILKLLYMQVRLSFSKTSCGFFFDDITNIETLNNIKNMLYVAQMMIENNYRVDEIKNIIEGIRKEKSNYDLCMSDIIDNLLKISETGFLKIACENVLLYSLNFYSTLRDLDWRFHIVFKDDNYEVVGIHLKTFEEEKVYVKMDEVKGNLIFKVKRASNDKVYLFTIDELNSKVVELSRILRSNDPKDLEIKRFCYLFSNSNIPLQIVEQYIKLLKNNLLCRLPFSYEFTKSVITLAAHTPYMDDIKSLISKTTLNKLIWKIDFIKELR